ncbi:RNA-binding protein [Grosmannia clavigera kw1407]|uniref:Pre-mRNA-splicing factor 38 n=1 Tax=Grosmannia clavigera (strain kw1407 / UAMH 11150) TaxID=655863 RepID=F0XUL2_GROCL|nr:RNA-binding protein [Grosmannia clavigera kw1407]EFW98794.1 RNA-binding protein [Grosmannia clavigera kw1407]
MSQRPMLHQADERRFLDERGSSATVAPNGLNPATIMEKAVRERIVDSYFWKEQCFGVNEADVVDRVVDHVNCIGGTTGTAQKPTPFLCLAFKLLQLAPNDEILAAYLQHGGERFKYLRALALFYVRLTRPADAVYRTLEPFLADRRKLRRRGRAGTTLTFVDDFVDDLLVKPRVCATSLWKLPSRDVLEDLGKLEPRVSPLGDIDEILDEEEEEARRMDVEDENDDAMQRDQDDRSDDSSHDRRDRNGRRASSYDSDRDEHDDRPTEQRRPRRDSRDDDDNSSDSGSGARSRSR